MDDTEPDYENNGKEFLAKYGLTHDAVTSLNLFLDGIQCGVDGALEIAKGLTQNWSLTSLELRRNAITSQGCVPIAQALASNKTLLHIGLGRNSIASTGGVHVAEALKVNQTLQSIDLEWNDLRDEAGVAIAEMLVLNNSLLAMSLERNKLQKDGVAAIGAALSSNQKLQTLNLGWNRARIVGAIAIAEGLRSNNHLINLNLAMNQIAQEGGFAIANALVQNTTLRSLNMQCNRIGESVIMLGESLRTNHTLRELNLEGNNITANLAAVFARGLKANGALMSLNLARNPIQDPGAIAVAEALKCGTAIRYLDLSETGVTHRAMPAVADLLDSCPNFQSLQLEDNVLGAEAGRHFALKIQQGGIALTSLNLNRTQLEAGGVKAIADALQGTPHHLKSFQLAECQAGYEPTLGLCKALCLTNRLVTLDLSGNGIGYMVKEHLCRVLLSNPNLPYIYLRGNDIAADLPNCALQRDEAMAFLTNLTGFTWSPPEASEQVDVEAFIPSSNFASHSASTGSTMQGPRNDLTTPSPVSLLAPARGTQIFHPGEGSTTHTKVLPLIPHGRAVSPVSPVDGLRRSSPLRGTLRPCNMAGGVMRATPFQINKLEANIGGLLLTDDQLRKEFNRLDRNGNGYLEFDEFKVIFKGIDNLGVEYTDREIESLLRRHNHRKDNKITYDEYCIIMLGLAAR